MPLTNVLYAPSFDFDIAVSDQGFPWITPVTIPAFTDLASSTETTVSDIGALMYWPTTPINILCSSTSASDTALGLGARTVRLMGLNVEWKETVEVVTLNGTTPVPTVNTFMRLHRADVLTAGSQVCNLGKLWFGTGAVTGGVPANKILAISVANCRSLSGTYSVPKGKNFYANYITIGTPESVEMTFRSLARNTLIGNLLRTVDKRVIISNMGQVVVR